MHDISRNSLFSRSVLAIWSVLSVFACTDPNKQKVAVVDGTVITAREVETALGRPLSQLHRQIYDLQRQKLAELIDERLLSEEAKRRGVSVAGLVEQEVTNKILPVTDDDILAVYNANKTRIPVELDKVREQIRDVLRKERLTAQKSLFIQFLRTNANVVIDLTPPLTYRVDVPITGAPTKGADKAQVTVVKFEDFQCPFCKQAQPALNKILARYGGKVRLIHKDLPLDTIHPQARQAAEAARCAGDQDKFWDYHDKLYESSPKAAPEDLKAYAKEVGLNQDSFEECLGTGKYKAVVQKDADDGAGLGITGTPAFFINGRELAGAQPIEAFAAMIDEELARAK
ncbi:MAG: thioredoxin domain-containing protein [Candidatus Binatia bacterium]